MHTFLYAIILVFIKIAPTTIDKLFRRRAPVTKMLIAPFQKIVVRINLSLTFFSMPVHRQFIDAFGTVTQPTTEQQKGSVQKKILHGFRLIFR